MLRSRAQFHLVAPLDLLELSRKSAIVGERLQIARRFRSVIHFSPERVAEAARPGLAFNIQRRGATPLVLLLKRSGQSWAKSGTSEL